MQEKKFYRLTSEGRSLWARRATSRLPLDYRRILGLVDYSGHPEVIRNYLARYPGHVVDQWLSEFEALRLIESIPATEVSLSAISRKTGPPPLGCSVSARLIAPPRRSCGRTPRPRSRQTAAARA